MERIRFDFIFYILLALLASLLLIGCTDYKGEEVTESSDIPPGRGLFTGPEGEYTIYKN